MNRKLQLLQSTLKLVFNPTMPYYAVAVGRKVGIFQTWNETSIQVTQFRGAKFKKFRTIQEAEAFVKQNTENRSPEKTQEKEKAPTNTSNEHEIWPDNISADGDDLLFEVAREIGDTSNVPAKRKLIDSGSCENKKTKCESTITEPIGEKKFGNFIFPIDSEGYVIVYTDGSCEGNGMSGAVAGLGVYFSENHPLNTAKAVNGRATNNCGEIQAAIYAIKIAKDLGISKLSISTDSQFLINSVTKWFPGWKRKGWKLKSGGDVKNVRDFKELDGLLQDKKIRIKWNYVRGHDGILGNEKADELARRGAAMYRELHRL